MTIAPRLCSYDNKVCPPRISGKGPGQCACDQNGTCQRGDMEHLSKLVFVTDKPPNAAAETPAKMHSVLLIEELYIEANLVPHRRGQLYALAADALTAAQNARDEGIDFWTAEAAKLKLSLAAERGLKDKWRGIAHGLEQQIHDGDVRYEQSEARAAELSAAIAAYFAAVDGGCGDNLGKAMREHKRLLDNLRVALARPAKGGQG